jgi:MFS family permease
MIGLAVALFAIQAGFHGFTASLPLALSRGGVPDPEIGLIVGTAALVQVPAAVLAGALVDRLGGLRMLVAGAIAYLAGAAILLAPGVETGGDRLPFVLARLFQGVGIAATLPAALSLVPRLVAADRQGFALAFIGSAHNLTLVALPPLSLAILSRSSLDGVTIAVVAIVVSGVVVLLAAGVPRAVRRGPPRPRAGAATTLAAPPPAARRRLGLAFRREWARPVLIVLLYVAHWGVITAYLPQRAEAAGADTGLFFVADGLAVLALRIPSGWLADRYPPRWVLLAGLAITAVSIGLLLLPPTTPLLVVAGILTGGGAGLLVTPILLELSRRSSEADRGSAFSLFSGALAAALVLGSIGAAPLVAAAGFEAAIAASIAGLALAAVVALGDPALRTARGRLPAPATRIGSSRTRRVRTRP